MCGELRLVLECVMRVMNGLIECTRRSIPVLQRQRFAGQKAGMWLQLSLHHCDVTSGLIDLQFGTYSTASVEKEA